MRDWDPDQVLKDMQLEGEIEPDPLVAAMNIARDRVPEAMCAVVHLALYSDNERIRLDASRELFTRAYNTSTDNTTNQDHVSESLYDKLSDLKTRIDVN